MSYVIQLKRPTSSHKRFWVGRGQTVTTKGNATQYAQIAHAKGAISRMGSYEKLSNLTLTIVTSGN